MPSNVTMEAIARAAGVSRATVSMALRDSPRISAAVRDKIKALATTMGYVKNPLVSALMETRRGRRSLALGFRLALVHAYDDHAKATGVGNSKPIWEGAVQRAGELGYRIEPFTIHGDPSHGRQLSRILWNRGIRGIILAYHLGDDERIEMEWDRFSLIGISHFFPSIHINRIMTNAVHMIRLAISKMQEHGCRRIALAVPEKGNLVSDYQFSGEYMNHYFRQKASDRIPPFMEGKEQWTLPRFSAWLRKYQPDALIGFGFKPHEWIEGSGHKIGKTIQFVQFGVLPGVSIRHHGIDQQPYAGGQMLAENLIRQINTNQTGIPVHPSLTMIEPQWIEATGYRQAQCR